MLATSLGFAVVQLDVSVVNVAIKPIGAEFGGGVSALQWVVNAYTVAFAALILTAGALGDRIGAKRVFTGGFVLFTVASAACGFAPDLGVLIAARAVQGVGAAALAVLAGTVIEGGALEFADPLVLAGFGLAVAAGTGFVVVETGRAHPMLPLGLFRSSTFGTASAIGLLINIAFYGCRDRDSAQAVDVTAARFADPGPSRPCDTTLTSHR